MIMPWLAAQKRHLSITTGSPALRADAAESAVCGYLALIALAGLVVNALWKVSWADAIAALAIGTLRRWVLILHRMAPRKAKVSRILLRRA
jgi:divalent metal cation (Fe/Co/Zn/Cd) transporter